MDRQIVWIGEIPQDTDILLTNKNTYIALSKLAAACFGTSTLLNNFSCTVGTGLTVVVSGGEIYSLQNIDNTAYGNSVAADTSNQILKQGILLSSTTLSCPAPTTAGQSINYLIEIAFHEADTGSNILPFYNSAAPTVPFTGPANNGQPSYTSRQNYAIIQAVAGTAATTGTQTTPSPDVGFVGAYVVTVDYGEVSLLSNDIVTYSGAPFLTNNLLSQINSLTTSVNSLLSNEIFYATDTGTVNTYACTISSITAYNAGQTIFLKITNANTSSTCTLNINSLGAINILLTNGNNINIGDLPASGIAILTYNGTNFELANPITFASSVSVQNNSYNYISDTGTANTYVATLSSAPSSYVAGLIIYLKIAHTNTSGTCTLNVNALGVKGIILVSGGSTINIGDLTAGMIAILQYDGTNFQLLNPYNLITSYQLQSGSYTYAADTGTANNYIVTLTPAPVSLYVGMKIAVKITNANTGASTINVNGLGAKNILSTSLLSLSSGQITANMIASLIYDGTQFQILNPISTIVTVNTIGQALLLGQRVYSA